MSKLYLNSTELLESIKVRCAVPISQTTFSLDNLLNFATEEMNLKIVPNVLAVKEEFYTTTETIPLVNNQSNYEIPYRSIGGKVRFVYLLRSDHTASPLAQLMPEDITEYQASSSYYEQAGFYLQNDEIVVLPPISGIATGSLVFKYYLKPNKIVQLKRGAQITAIDTVTGDVTVSAVPSNIMVGSEIDFIQSRGNFKTLGFDVIPSAVNTGTNVITIPIADLPATLSVGDYICTAGETVIPQIPSELHVMLAQAVACRILESLGDSQGLTNATAKLQDMEQKLLAVIDTRVEAPGRKIVNKNTLLRSRRFNRRWY